MVLEEKTGTLAAPGALASVSAPTGYGNQGEGQRPLQDTQKYPPSVFRFLLSENTERGENGYLPL